MSEFKDKVIQIVRLVPPGKVVSYGQVAAYAGMPRAAREVGWTLNGMNEKDLPWWRVINNQGYISIRGNQTSDKDLQRKLLEAEHIVVSDQYEVAMHLYRYIMPAESLKKLQLSDAYIETLIKKYSEPEQLAIL